MTIHRALRDRFLTQSVTKTPSTTGANFYGDPTLSTGTTSYFARVEGKQHLVKGPDGREVLARTIVFIGPTTSGSAPSLTVRDRLTLPDGSKPPILSVDTLRDRTGVAHLVAHCG